MWYPGRVSPRATGRGRNAVGRGAAIAAPLWYACVLELEARRDGVVPVTHGHQLHALFLDLVRGVDPALSAALHEGFGRRPFTLSPLRGLPPAAGHGHAVAAGTRLAFRLTLLDPALLGGLVVALLSEGGVGDVRLGATPFRVCRVATAPDQHPWAGIAAPRRLLDGADAARAIALRFATPTAFSLGTRSGAGKVVETLPRPELLFGGLLSAWNAFSGVPLDPALRRLIAERVVVSRFQLQSSAYRFRDHVQIGAVGACTYDVKGQVPADALRQLNALADAALYLGVGYRTTMGMGQARREPCADGGERNGAGAQPDAVAHG